MGEEQHLTAREMDKWLADDSDETRLESLNKSESTGDEDRGYGGYTGLQTKDGDIKSGKVKVMVICMKAVF